MNIHPDILRRVFWHRTRRTFVPLTGPEFTRRIGYTPVESQKALTELVQHGMVKGAETRKSKDMVYEISPKGLQFVGAQP